jgi:hypothetical protein
MNMNPKIERFIFGLILSPLAPVAGFLVAWWFSFEVLPEKMIPFGTLLGLALGILADVFILKNLIARARQLKLIFWAAVFLFYTIGIFGMFMGVPVFNALLAIPAGFVIAIRLDEQKIAPAGVGAATRQTAWFTTAVLFFICVASAFIALVSSSTASDLKGMLGLGFEVTQGMIVGLILVGGLALLAFNWFLTAISLWLSYKFFHRKGWSLTPVG